MSFARFKTSTFRSKISWLLIAVGLLCLGLFFTYRSYQGFRRTVLSFSRPPELTAELEEALLPVSLSIPDLGLELLVTPVALTGNEWPIFDDQLAYLLGSGSLGKSGNVIIYGHNRWDLLGRIGRLEKDAEISLKAENGEVFTYTVAEIRTVSPERVEILQPTEEPILTLYTCTGFLDQERLVVMAELER